MLKKISQKVLAVMFIMMTLISSMAPVSAANAALPDSAKKGSITVHKYEIEQDELTGLPDATGVKLDKNNAAISGRTPIENIEFKITKVEAKDANTPLSATAYKVDNSFTAKTQATNADGETTFSDLPIGYYLVQEIDHPLVTVKCADFIVAVPMTDPVSGSNFMYDIHVYPKNVLGGEPTIALSVTDLGNISETIGTLGTEGNGEVRNATVIATAELPADIAIAQDFVITVKCDDQLNYLADTVTVKVYPNADRKASEEITLVKNQDFTVINGSHTVSGEASSKAIGIALTNNGQAKIDAGLPTSAENTVSDKPVLDLSFEVSAVEGIAMGEAVIQTANLEYHNSLNVSRTYTSNDIELHTGGFSLKNVDAESRDALAGAQFKIYNSEVDAKAGANAVKNTNGDDLIGTSDENGMIQFNGLPYGTTGNAYDSDEVRSYWVVQVQAPQDAEGNYYELLRSAFEVEVSRASHQPANTIEIAHSKPFVLPNTGLTSISLIGAGFAAMTVAGFFLVNKKRKQAA